MNIDQLKILITHTPNFGYKVKNMPEIIMAILNHTQFFDTDVGMPPRIYCILHNITQRPSCKACGKHTKFKGPQLGFNVYCCSKCSNSDPVRIYNTQQTNIKKYGTKWNITSLQSKQKRNMTCLKKYGTAYPLLNDQIKQKSKQTCLTKYGVDNPRKSKQIKQKMKNTWLDKYGVERPPQNEQIKQKMKNTWLDKYGVDNPQKSELIRQKFRNTCLKKYGTAYPLLNDQIKQKSKQTCLTKYHVECFSQHHMLNTLPLIQDYNWLYDQYVNQNKTAATIACELGVDDTTIGNYLRKHEIAIKYSYKYSFMCILWLEQLEQQQNIYIQHALNEGEYSIPGTKYKADGFCVETNTIYEFHGNCFHGNPKIFAPDVLCHPFNDLTAGELYEQTMQREQTIKDLGYNLVVMWESDFSTT